MTMAVHSGDAQALASLLAYGEWNPQVGREVVDELRGLGARAAPALAELLKSSPASD